MRTYRQRIPSIASSFGTFGVLAVALLLMTACGRGDSPTTAAAVSFAETFEGAVSNAQNDGAVAVVATRTGVYHHRKLLVETICVNADNGACSSVADWRSPSGFIVGKSHITDEPRAEQKIDDLVSSLQATGASGEGLTVRIYIEPELTGHWRTLLTNSVSAGLPKARREFVEHRFPLAPRELVAIELRTTTSPVPRSLENQLD